MDMAKIAPWALGGLVLLAVLMMNRGRGGPAYVVADAGTGYAESVTGAQAVMSYQLARESIASDERVRQAEIGAGLQLGTGQLDVTRELGLGALDLQRTLGLESLSVERFLGGLQIRAAQDAAAEAAAVRRDEIDASARRDETQAATQREVARGQQQSNIVQSFLGFVGTIIGGLIGLSGDAGYYDRLRELDVRQDDRSGSWGLMPVGGRTPS